MSCVSRSQLNYSSSWYSQRWSTNVSINISVIVLSSVFPEFIIVSKPFTRMSSLFFSCSCKMGISLWRHSKARSVVSLLISQMQGSNASRIWKKPTSKCYKWTNMQPGKTSFICKMLSWNRLLLLSQTQWHTYTKRSRWQPYHCTMVQYICRAVFGHRNKAFQATLPLAWVSQL